MRSVRSADRRKRPRLGFGTALVPLSRPHLYSEHDLGITLCDRLDSRVNRPCLHSRHATSEKLNGILGLSVPPEPEFALERPQKRPRLQDEDPARLALP